MNTGKLLNTLTHHSKSVLHVKFKLNTIVTSSKVIRAYQYVRNLKSEYGLSAQSKERRKKILTQENAKDSGMTCLNPYF